MDGNHSTLGTCPDCGRAIESAQFLIDYEKADGSTGVFAECPECNDVVEPT